MKRVLLTFMVIVAGLAMAAPDASAQSGNRNGRTDKGQSNMDAWQKDMAEFRARSDERRHIQELTDSIASVQAFAAVKNQDFVLEAQTVQFRNGATVFVNDMTNFISVKGNRMAAAVMSKWSQISPAAILRCFSSSRISGQEYRVGKKGLATYSFSVTGIGINAQIEIYLTPGTNQASATIYPNFNANTVWVQGNIVPYENSRVIEGSSL